MKKLLICTQAVDKGDPALGFFHEWIAALAAKFDSVEVICLQEGRYALPGNVHVHSLGKSAQGRPASGWEIGRSRIKYITRFYRYAIGLSGEYDTVFIHQNQEYVLLAGWLWKLLGKRIFMWRNHYAGSFFTDVAAAFCTKVFCTSKHSYTAKYKKTVRMPVGVDTKFFSPRAEQRIPRSILFLGRITPAKHPEVLIEALGKLAEEGIDFSATMCGPTLPKDEAYLASLKRRANELHLSGKVVFKEGIPHAETPALYASHDIFVNLAESGMYDKTLFEAAASGCLVVSTSRDFAELLGSELALPELRADSLAETLRRFLAKSAEERGNFVQGVMHVVVRNNLRALADALALAMRPIMGDTIVSR